MVNTAGFLIFFSFFCETRKCDSDSSAEDVPRHGVVPSDIVVEELSERAEAPGTGNV